MEKTKKMVLTAMMCAVLCVLSVLQIPMPSGVPITLQTFAVALCGYVLGQTYGAISAMLYLLIGFIGIPVYAGFKAGPSALFGVTGGFIFGFILLAFFCGLGKKKSRGFGFFLSIILGIIGLACCHTLGAIQFSYVAHQTILQSFLLVSVPYIVKDVLSIIGAKVASLAINKALEKAHFSNIETA